MISGSTLFDKVSIFDELLNLNSFFASGDLSIRRLKNSVLKFSGDLLRLESV